jgi:hypothetical protein
MTDRFFFTLHPTHARYTPKGSATHYAQKGGIVRMDPHLARYIFNSVKCGNEEPEIFVCGWHDKARDTVNVGMEIPRTRKTDSQPTSEVRRDTLDFLFEAAE